MKHSQLTRLFTLFIILFGLSLASCSSDSSLVMKRRYNKGYYVTISRHRSKHITLTDKPNTLPEKRQAVATPPQTAKLTDHKQQAFTAPAEKQTAMTPTKKVTGISLINQQITRKQNAQPKDIASSRSTTSAEKVAAVNMMQHTTEDGNGSAVIGFILALAGLLPFLGLPAVIGLVGSLFGIIFSYMGRNSNHRTLAMIGLFINIVLVILDLLLMLAVIVL